MPFFVLVFVHFVTFVFQRRASLSFRLDSLSAFGPCRGNDLLLLM